MQAACRYIGGKKWKKSIRETELQLLLGQGYKRSDEGLDLEDGYSNKGTMNGSKIVKSSGEKTPFLGPQRMGSNKAGDRSRTQ
ncbi:hypothetical protein KFK09_020795 [Dendrobium nobile]|uniref:Uncharacterized protein n=1 Tax=Dendrobium nobile TaxID=94219 RepID=A0A8T3ANF8_DENNO|nr:hypothetical protein KFK09_020795 [Dendrobium nobile]